MLSALIQSEAAIIAIVITLSLVAVQFAASSYSARMVDAFKKTPDLWILIVIYILAMIYGLGVLKLIEKTSPTNSVSNLENHIFLSYYLGISVFLSLIPYIYNTLNLLKPSTVISTLSERITKQNILSVFGRGQERYIEKDPIQPIIDIVRGSLMKYDYETAKDGLITIRERTNDIFKNENFGMEEATKIYQHIFSHLTGIGKFASSRGDEESTIEAIIILQENGKRAIEQGLEKSTRLAVESLGKIGLEAAKQKLEKATCKIAITLREIGLESAEKNLEDATYKTATSLKEVGLEAAKQKLENVTREVTTSLGEVGLEAAKQKLEKATHASVISLREVGIELAEQQLDSSMEIEALRRIGIVALDQELHKANMEVIFFLGEVGATSAEYKQENATSDAIKSLEEIGEKAKKPEARQAVVKSLVKIRHVITFELVGEWANEYLGKIAEIIGRLEK